MQINTLGNMIMIAKGMPMLAFRFSLVKKENKNEEEKVA